MLRRRRGARVRGRAAVGPFAGRDAIVAAYRERPPDDEVRLGDPGEDGETVVAPYAWAAAPDRPAGRILLSLRGGAIERLVVTFDAE